MHVRMISPMAGPDVAPASAGDVIEVDAKQGKELIDSGHAVEADAPEKGGVIDRFSGGLTPVSPATAAAKATVPPVPGSSHARAVAAYGDDAIDRRTADEVAADARYHAELADPDVMAGPKTGDEAEAHEVAKKVAAAQAKPADVKGATKSAAHAHGHATHAKKEKEGS